jgi:hypothetical protein
VQYRKELQLVRETFAKSGEEHWREFVERWSQ